MQKIDLRYWWWQADINSFEINVRKFGLGNLDLETVTRLSYPVQIYDEYIPFFFSRTLLAGPCLNFRSLCLKCYHQSKKLGTNSKFRDGFENRSNFLNRSKQRPKVRINHKALCHRTPERNLSQNMTYFFKNCFFNKVFVFIKIV